MRLALLALFGLPSAVGAPTITVNTTLTTNLGWVQVSWTGLTPAEAKEGFIGVYSPADVPRFKIGPLPYPATAPWTATSPIKYLPLAAINATTGSGTWAFELINMYTDVSFSLFNSSIDDPQLVATSEAVQFAPVAEPLRGHLARTTDPSEIVVTWNSAQSDDAPTVQYGLVSGVYTRSAAANSTTYGMGDMCGAPANTIFGWFPPGWWNSAVMTGLLPATPYYYRYGSALNGWSPEFRFRSAELPAPSTPLNIIVYADQGMSELDGSTDHWAEPSAWSTEQRMVALAATGAYSLALHVGDVSYATGLESKWFLFDERAALLGRQLPVMIGHGNHERDYPGSGASRYYETSTDSGGECGLATATRYPMPWDSVDAQGRSANSSWFAMTQGPAAIVMLNSELPVENTSTQFAWLARTLAAVDRRVTPWLIVALHRPMYFGATRDSNLAQLEALLYSEQVDLVLTGHIHYAEVFCPQYKGVCVAPAAPGAYDAPVHVVIGNAGQGLTPIDGAHPTIRFHGSYYGYSTVAIPSPELLVMSLYDDSTGALTYSFNITRTFPRAG